ncbi:MAG TPA: acyloxyacyl hydrolase [Stellaceae bacterium]|jgi:lipid A 3-O-deacylase|nr:acyloxyacyl hydrolase [Stellaceae bacterium]
MIGKQVWRKLAIAGALALAALLPTRSQAQTQNITYSEFKFGVWDHDVHFLGGKEHGADINPEVIIASPITNDMIANAPWWLYWTLQPRPTIGAAINTAGDTDQFYVGATWSWFLTQNIINPGDGIVLGYFFGPGFNDGEIQSHTSDRKALGSHVLFREALDLGYQINPTWEISVYLDHISNGGLAKENQSINDVGLRLGYRF